MPRYPLLLSHLPSIAAGLRRASNARSIYPLPMLGAALLALGGCTPAPVLKSDTAAVAVAPFEAAAEPERYHDAAVVWGGMILDVHNRVDASEIEILAYPLDAGQRPLVKQPAQGRFLAVLSGYVERYDYPQGRFVTLSGQLLGSRVAKVQERDYVYPLVNAQALHLWPADFAYGGPQFHVGVGIGISR